jgi:hypothetical protein
MSACSSMSIRNSKLLQHYLQAILCTINCSWPISKRATFLERPYISSPAWRHPCFPWCSLQPANKQKEIRVKYSFTQRYRSLKMGPISCSETLAYFKYTPVKARIKIIANTHFQIFLINLPTDQTNSMVWVRERTIPTAACRQSDCQLLQIKGAMWSAWRIPTAVFSVF